MSLLETTIERGVCTITLADEARRNALSGAMLTELIDAIDVAETHPLVRVVVLTNRGRTFCAGADLSEQRDAAPGTRPPVGLVDLLARIRQSPKPFVGRIDGHCVAGGVGLAAVLDVAVAVREVTFGFTEVRLGLAPAMIAVVCLPKMRRGDAQEAFLRGTRFDGAEAARLGLIAHAVAREDLDATVDGVVSDLLAGEPGAIAEIKRLVSVLPGLADDEAFAWAAELSARLFTSPSAREGMNAYLEKRPAAWVRRLDDDR